MRVLVFFDLPVKTAHDRRNYRSFHRYLVSQGFFMLQKSIYSKLALNMSVAGSIMSDVRRHKPPAGFVILFVLTEKQYSRMEIVCGKLKTDVLNSCERVVVI